MRGPESGDTQVFEVPLQIKIKRACRLGPLVFVFIRPTTRGCLILRFKVVPIALAALIGLAGAQHADAKKAERPCQFHTATTKVTKTQCVAQYKKTVRARLKARNIQIKRDRAYWPPAPVTTRDLNVRGVNIQAFARLGVCEAGRGSGAFGVRWNTPPGWTWQGGLGMYRGTHQSVGHPYERDIGQASWQTQMLVAHRVMQKYGITAWAAHRCYTG